jgi:outer membrane protein
MRTFVAAALSLISSAAFAETLSVEEAVRRALESSPQVQAARERKLAADDAARSVRGQFGPQLGVSDELQHYSGPFNRQVQFDSPIPGAPPIQTQFPIRDQNTNTFAASARQPVIGLLRISQDFVAANQQAEAAQAALEVTERAMREAMESAYLRMFEARAAREVAKSSQVQLAEQLSVAQARVEAGALTTADVLRVQVAKANIQQQELQAGVQESDARNAILTLLGLPVESPIEFAEPVSLEVEAEKPAPDFQTANDEAQKYRPDLKQQLHLLDSAEATARSRLASLLPDIDLTAAYVRVDGQALAQQDAAYIGVRMSWPIWMWGTQWYAHRAAVHQAESNKWATVEASRSVQRDVSSRLDLLRSATSAIDVAKTALTSAEEAYRVTSAVVQAGSGTTTDLLDAQSALTQAKLNLVRSRYQQALARVQLRRAMGG